MITLPEIANGEDKSSPFVNCIRNTYKHVRKFARRTSTNCFRLFDRELYHYPLAIDYYDGRYSVHYFTQDRESDDPPISLQEEVEKALFDLFRVEPSSIYWRSRIKRKKLEQYEKANDLNEFFTVYEYGAKFRINLVDYLDSGLFLDHRETRKLVATLAPGKKLLNLFAYTCSFSVHAAINGASFTKSVDMSNTYTEWGRENFILNGFGAKNHEIVRADCLKFMDEEIRSGMRYDLIVIDPPTISRSKKMDQMFDIQVDYIFLIAKALELLLSGGTIIFSTNSRRFVFDKSHFAGCTIQDISHKIQPIDFRDPKIHQCWKISLPNH